MDAEFEKRVRAMERYIPSLEALIKKLESSKHEMSCAAQLAKMQTLYNLLTKKDKKYNF